MSGNRIPLGARFSSPVQYSGYRIFTGLKRSGRGVDHPPPSSAEVGGRVELYICFLSGPSWLVGRTCYPNIQCCSVFHAVSNIFTPQKIFLPLISFRLSHFECVCCIIDVTKCFSQLLQTKLVSAAGIGPAHWKLYHLSCRQNSSVQ